MIRWRGPRVPELVRGIEAANYLESFLVSAVAAIIATRLYLELTGYPRLGGGGLHIAHMLWGGLLMLAALVLLLAFLGKPIKRTAAIVGGVGFGLFIDELGKFITSDNDYFYEPAMALIYVVFIALFGVVRAIERRRGYTETERLVNAADLIKEVFMRRASEADVQRGLELLEGASPHDRVAQAIKSALLAAAYAPPPAPSWPAKLALAVHRGYLALLRWRGFRPIIAVLLVAEASTTILLSAVLLMLDPTEFWLDLRHSVPDTMTLVASILTSALVVAGVVRLRRSRLSAYRLFKLSVLFSIFFTQIFSFVDLQLLGLIALGQKLLVLTGLNVMIDEEIHLQHRAAADVPTRLTA